VSDPICAAAGGFAAGGVSGGNIESAVTGAIQAAALFGVGEGLGHTDAGMFQGNHVARIFAHATIGCVASGIQGGKCGAGAASAGFAAFAGPLIDTGSFAGDLAGHAVAGGIGARLGGGKFGNGALTGAFGYLFNTVAAKFNRETGVLKVVDNDTGKRVKGLFFSGNSDNGEIDSPPDQAAAGIYAILQRGDKEGFRLEAIDSKFGDDKNNSGQTHLRLHGPGGSIGCITACNQSSFDRVENLIRKTLTKEVTVDTFKGLNIRGVDIIRFNTGTEKIKYYGILEVK